VSDGDAGVDCIFCRIVAEEIPAEVLAGGELSLAIRDIAPAGPFHALVIPRAHIADARALHEGHGELLSEMFELARLVATDAKIDESGYRLVMNIGEDGGNTVAHLHLHVIGGRPLAWPPG
jgi:histidine triad (HIT) family protein